MGGDSGHEKSKKTKEVGKVRNKHKEVQKIHKFKIWSKH